MEVEAAMGSLSECCMPAELQRARLTRVLPAALTPLLRYCPVAVLWGYFAYMALDSLPGNQFWQRLLLLGTDRTQHYRSHTVPCLHQAAAVDRPACHLLGRAPCCVEQATCETGGQSHDARIGDSGPTA